MTTKLTPLRPSEIPTGAVALTAGKSFIAKGIRVFMEYSHALTFYRKNDQLMIIEADGTDTWGKPGVSEIPFSKYLTGKPETKILLLIPRKQSIMADDIFIENMSAQIGKKYDYRRFFFQFRREVAQLFARIDIANIAYIRDTKKKWICAELAAWGLYLKYAMYEGRWPRISPDDIHNDIFLFDAYLYDEKLNLFMPYEPS